MKQRKVVLPPALDFERSIRLSLDLSAIGAAEEFLIDCSKVSYVEPFGMLLAAIELNRLRGRFPGSTLTVIHHQHLSYAAHMGLFKAFGVPYGKAPGQARGNESYLPVTIIKRAELESSAAQSGVEVQDEVERQSRALSEILARSNDGDLVDTLTYSLRELMRNVIEHAHAPELAVCAQYWPTKERVEVAILDSGIGLRRSLANNPHIDASDDKKAINYALMPAVSGKAFKGARKRPKGVWANSGFGLYMTNRIARNGGTFFVASGQTGMLLTERNKRYYECAFDGTAIRMVIRTRQLPKLRDALDRYRKDGYEIQRTYEEIVNIDPSSASMMLSEDLSLPVWQRLLATLKGK
jgi:hypothetical protein